MAYPYIAYLEGGSPTKY